MPSNEEKTIKPRSTAFFSIPIRYLLCFISTLVWGLLAHGMTLFNKYSFYEDPSQLFGVGATYTSGRWMLDVIHKFEVFFLGGSYSLPLLNGIMSIVYIGLCACITVKLLHIQRSSLIVLLSGIFVATPCMVGLFGYMFTAPHYCFGYLLASAGVLLICHHRKWYCFLAGTVFIACSIGIYQATIPLALSLMLLWFICHVHDQRELPWKLYFLTVLYLIVACLVFLFMYFIANRLYLRLQGATLSSYQGIDEMGTLSISTYLNRVIYAYKVFLLPYRAGNGCMYPNGLIYLYWLLFGLSIVTGSVLLFFCAKQSISKLFQVGIPLVFIPLAVNFIYVMCDPSGVHTLMVFSQVMLPAFLFWEIGQLLPKIKKHHAVKLAALIFIPAILCSMYVRIDNICYLKAEMVQSQTTRYYSTMITRIQETKGYQNGMPVAYVGFHQKTDSSLPNTDAFSTLDIIPYFDTDSMINGFAARSFVENWCGFAPVVDYSPFSDMPQVQEMPCYPADGSIKVINDVVVIKFS